VNRTIKKRILFFGELPPKSVHGVSFSNDVNISILSSKFEIDIIEEYIDLIEHGRFSIKKYFAFLNYCIQVVKFSLKKRYDYFYSTFSLSFIGCVKTFVPILLFKLLNQKAKVITHIHRGDYNIFYNRNLFFKIISYLIFKLDHKVIFLSEKFIFKNLPFSRKYIVLANTICNPFDNQLNRKRNNLLYISNYIEEKGILNLLESFKIVNNKMVLSCYGQFTSSGIKDKVLSYSSKDIRINDYLNDEKLKYDIISSSYCLILPSHNEGQPLIILEAMSVGTIIIASKVGDIPNMLGDQYPFLVEPNSTQDLVKAIKKISDLDLNEYFKLSEYLKNRFLEKFSLKSHKIKLLDIFD